MIKNTQNELEKDYNLEDLNLLQGKLIVASPIMPDERFFNSVILMCNSKSASSFGFVVNGDELENSKLREKLNNTAFKNKTIYSGGPVDEHKIFILHSLDKKWGNTLLVGNFGITNLNDALKNTQTMPKQYMILAGYTNWLQFQLEREISIGFWLITPAKKEIVFNDSYISTWKKCMQSLNLNVNTFAQHIGSS